MSHFQFDITRNIHHAGSCISYTDRIEDLSCTVIVLKEKKEKENENEEGSCHFCTSLSGFYFQMAMVFPEMLQTTLIFIRLNFFVHVFSEWWWWLVIVLHLLNSELICAHFTLKCLPINYWTILFCQEWTSISGRQTKRKTEKFEKQKEQFWWNRTLWKMNLYSFRKPEKPNESMRLR